MVSLTGKQPTHCGVVALPLSDIKICKAQKGEQYDRKRKNQIFLRVFEGCFC